MNVLEGIRVVDLSQNIAGPHCTQILADLGAAVVKIEPPRGDPTRSWGPPFWQGESPLFLAFNRGKRSVAVDLEVEVGREVVHRLVRGADVVVQAFRPGVAERFGLAPEELLAADPELVCVTITGYGARGPLASRPGYDPLIQAYSGVMSLTGFPDGPPARVGGSVVDVGTGILTALGVLAALRERDRIGRGGHVEGSLLATSVGWLPYHLQGYLASGVVPGRMGTGLAMVAPYEAFDTADGELMIAAGNDAMFGRLCAALDLPDVADDERFRENPGRVSRRAELHALLEARTRALGTAELREVLDAHAVPSAPVQDIAAVAADPQVQAEGILRPADHPSIADYQDVAFPLRFDGARPPPGRAPPGLGEHTHEVLAELGYTADEIETLVQDGRVVASAGGG